MSGNSCLIAVLTLKDIKRVVRINCHFHQEEFMPFKRNGNWYAGYFFINEVDLSKFVCLRWIFTCLDASRGVIRYIDAIIYLISRISEHTCDILNVFFWMKKRYLRSSARPSVAWHWMSRESSPGTYGSNWWRVPSALTVYTFQDDPHYSDSPDDKTDSLKKNQSSWWHCSAKNRTHMYATKTCDWRIDPESIISPKKTCAVGTEAKGILSTEIHRELWNWPSELSWIVSKFVFDILRMRS